MLTTVGSEERNDQVMTSSKKMLKPLNEKELLDWLYDNRREFGSYPLICNEQFFKNLCKEFGTPLQSAGVSVAFICAGNHRQYQNFIDENHLDRRRFPMLTEDNWRGVMNASVIRIGTYYENQNLRDMLPYIEQYFKERTT
jgi:hypothetical protein